MLGRLDAGMERFRRVIGVHGNPLLGDDFSGIDILINEVDGAAGFLHTGGERLLPGPQTLEGGEKGRMNIDHPSRKRL